MEQKIEQKQVEVLPVNLGMFKLKVENISGSTLFQQKMSDIVKKELDEKYGKGKVKGKSSIKRLTEKEEMESKIWRTLDGKPGYPASGFQKAIIQMAKSPHLQGIDGTLVSGAVQVLGNIIPIKFKKQVKNVGWGKQSGRTGAPMKIIRPEFIDWSCELMIQYDASMINEDNIINLFNMAGFHKGIGSWRPGLPGGGNHGMFQVAEQ